MYLSILFLKDRKELHDLIEVTKSMEYVNDVYWSEDGRGYIGEENRIKIRIFEISNVLIASEPEMICWKVNGIFG